MKTIAILGTFDTKGKEFKYIKDLIEAAGLQTLCIHTGVFEPLFTPDVSNAEVAAAVGVDLAALAARKDRGEAMDVMARGAEKLVPELFARGRLDGILSIGGSGGTSLATPAMRALPVGVPKVMVSTMASGNVAQYVGTSDIIMIPSVVDAEGLNEISKRIFTNAANAIVGMVANYREIPNDGKPLLAATMFGVTTPCIKTAKAYLESKGYEVLVFHATGAGGRSMEALIDAGFTLYNHDTAEYLLKDTRQLMPGPSTRKAREIAAKESMQWNKGKIQSAVTQGILQGEGPYKVAERLRGVAEMDYNASVRYARTMTTSAQNAGRYESYRRAKKLGVDLTIEWQATLDGRTRHAHRLMHGQRTTVDEPFETPDGYTIFYPADCSGESDAPQNEIWNCRCTLLAWVTGFEEETVRESPKMGDMSFEEWLEATPVSRKT